MRRASLAALTLAGTAAAHAAGAQGLPPAALGDPATVAPALTFGLSQSVEADSNYDLVEDSPGTTYFGDTRFTLDYLKETRTSSLAFGIDTGLRALQQPEQDFEWEVATPSLGYATYRNEGVNTSFDVDLRARSRRVDTLDIDFLPGTPPDDLSQFSVDTREQRYDADIGFTFGTSSPSTYEFRLLATTFDYTKEVGSSLVPRTTLQGQALWTLGITPVFSTALFGDYYYYTADDTEDSELRVAEIDAGVVYQPDLTLRLRGGVGYAKRTREETNFGVRETLDDNSGPSVRGDFFYILPNLIVSGNARWSTANPDSPFLGFLSATYSLPRGQVSGRLFQQPTSSSDGEEARVTGAGIGLTRDINNVSSFGLDFAYAFQESLDDEPEPDITRSDVTASYTYELTAAVSAEVGYTYSTRIEDPVDANSHRVYVQIGRIFETGL